MTIGKVDDCHLCLFQLLILVVALSTASCDVLHVLEDATSTPPPPPRPYAFGYAAGRFRGHIDRTHSEISDGSGIIQGSYSYVDPSNRIRTVDYVADKEGFHPVLNFSPSPLPKDSDAVAAAREKHFRQYDAIASKHQVGYVAVPRDSAAVAHARDVHLQNYAAIAEAHRTAPQHVVVPYETAAVQRATAKHYDLFQRIAAEHARIAAEREAQRLADEAAAEPNQLKEY